MAKLAMNKSALNRERKKLDNYRRYLPSLELKQKQLIGLRREATAEVDRVTSALAREQQALGERLPMLGSEQFDLRGMLEVETLRVVEENAVGVALPAVETLRVGVRPYSFVAEPHWVDVALECLRRVVRLRIEAAVAEERLRRVERALRTITQRVNLFREVLIPGAEDDIRRIRIHLGDAERSAVIRAKIAKTKRAQGSRR